MSELVRNERVGGVAVWTIARPSARNAIDRAVASELARLLDDAERDASLRAVVLTGAGDAVFVAGADLKLLSSSADAGAQLATPVLSALGRLEALPLPVFAALNGAALGGGCEVALACDVRIAEPHASLTFKHAALSMTPGWGGLARLARTVGPGAAAKLLYTALPLPAEEALRLGLFDELVPKGQARARALELAAAVAQTSASAVADLKHLLRLAYAGQLTPDEEQRVFLARCVSADHQEALAAFREKRKPDFGAR